MGIYRIKLKNLLVMMFVVILLFGGLSNVQAEGNYTYDTTTHWTGNFIPESLWKIGDNLETKNKYTTYDVELTAGDIKWKGNALTVSFGKVSLAKGYDIFLQRGGKKYTTKPVATVKSTKNQVSIRKISGKKLNQRKSYKLVVKAYRIINGKKKYIAISKELRFVGRKSKLTNAKKVSVKKKSVSLTVGKKTKISATVKKENARKKLYKGDLAKYRYWSTNASIATVSKSGVITAKKRGTCYVYVMTANGKKASVKVVVK